MAAGEKKENKLIERHGSKKAYEPGREEKKKTRKDGSDQDQEALQNYRGEIINT